LRKNLHAAKFIRGWEKLQADMHPTETSQHAVQPAHTRHRLAESAAKLLSREASTATDKSEEKETDEVSLHAGFIDEECEGGSGDGFEDAQWMPGRVVDVLAGCAEASARLEEAMEMGVSLVAMLWSAPWLHNAGEVDANFGTVAAARPGTMCLCIDVLASDDNRSLAFEKVRGMSALM
jgi:hypothetical protein